MYYNQPHVKEGGQQGMYGAPMQFAQPPVANAPQQRVYAAEGMAYNTPQQPPPPQQREQPVIPQPPSQVKSPANTAKSDAREGDAETDGDSLEGAASSMWFPAVTLEVKDDQHWQRPSTSEYVPPPLDDSTTVEVFVCNNCYETFRELATLRQHLLANRGVCCFVCDKCGKLYESPAALAVHEIVHADEAAANVKHEPSDYRPNLAEGEARDWPAVDSPVAAERGLIMYAGVNKCAETPLTRGKRTARGSSRTENTNRPFPCTVDGCNRSYLCKSHLLGHVKEAHAVGYTFACDICNRRFQRNATLKRHKFLVHVKGARSEECSNGDVTVFSCEVCDKTFPRNATLKRHRMMVHAKAAYSPGHAFECETCNKRFRRNSSLTRHNLYVHSETNEDRPFTCSFDQCGKRYKHKNHLKAHMAKHPATVVETRPPPVPAPPVLLKCSIGIQVGRSAGSLDKRRSEDNMFACEICEKAFPRNYTLNRHRMLVHGDSGNERPYVCDIDECGKSYKLKYHLKDHMRKHSKVSMLRL